VAYCFAIAEDAAAPSSRRLLALRVLHLAIPDEDTAAHERRARLSARLSYGHTGARLSTAGDAVAYAQRAVRYCFRRMLEDDAAFHGQVRLTLHVALKERTSSWWAEGTAPPELRACVIGAVSHFTVTSSAQIGTELMIPFTFFHE
jgi:hypothetical protein